jgi:hypothetical protein
MGGSVGAAVVGSLFVHRLTDRLATRIPPGVHAPHANSITPALIKELPEPVRTIFRHAFADALTPIYLYLVPVVAVAFVLAWLLKEIPLRTSHAPAPAADGALGQDRQHALAAGLVLTLIAERMRRHGRPDDALTTELARLAGDHPGSPIERARHVTDHLVRPAAIGLLGYASGSRTTAPGVGTLTQEGS